MRRVGFSLVGVLFLCCAQTKGLKVHKDDPNTIELKNKCPHVYDRYSTLRKEYGMTDTLISEVMRGAVRNAESPVNNSTTRALRQHDDTCCLIGLQRAVIRSIFGIPETDIAKGSVVGRNSDNYFHKFWPISQSTNSLLWSKEIIFNYDSTNVLKSIRYAEWTPWWDESSTGKNRGKKWPTEQNK
jgi:hypothetical protein